jgi:hypothetical protein
MPALLGGGANINKFTNMDYRVKRLLKKIVPNSILKYRIQKGLDKQRVLFHQNCQEFLELIDTELRKAGIEYWLNYGTLLGAYREHAFIAHDYDLDLGLFWEDRDKIKDIMLAAGATLKVEFRCGSWKNPEYMEMRFEYKNVYADFDFYKIEDGIAYSFLPAFLPDTPNKIQDYTVVLTEVVTQKFVGLKEMEFLGRLYKVPANTEEYLIENYGKDFMTPIKDFEYHDYASNIKQYTLEEKKSYSYNYY